MTLEELVTFLRFHQHEFTYRNDTEVVYEENCRVVLFGLRFLEGIEQKDWRVNILLVNGTDGRIDRMVHISHLELKLASIYHEVEGIYFRIMSKHHRAEVRPEIEAKLSEISW